MPLDAFRSLLRRPPAGSVQAMERADERTSAPGSRKRRVGLVVGPALFFLVVFAPPPTGLSVEAWRTAAVALLMATWWLTEAAPLPVTALLPVIVFPLIHVAPIGVAAEPYANPIVFLFLGGFMIALSLERWNVHLRLALAMLKRVGSHPVAVVGGFMAAAALLSMWVSNTATTLMMIPLAASVLAYAKEGPGRDKLAVVLVLATAYGASIGGLGTLIGSPPNALFAGFLLESQGIRITFLQWMLIGLPVVLVGLPLAWFLLTRVAYSLHDAPRVGGPEVVREETARLGPLGAPERRVLVVFAITASLWIFNPLVTAWTGLPLTDASVGLAGAFLLFLVPSGRGGPLLDWATASKLPWGILVLVGGGLSLAGSIQRTGLAAWIGDLLSVAGLLPTLLLVLVVVGGVMLLSELTSNTATAATFLPVVAALAFAIGADSVALTLAVALAASCAFMLPVATPPNAVAYSTGRVTAAQMARGGVFLSLLFLVLVTLLVTLWAPLILGAGLAGAAP